MGDKQNFCEQCGHPLGEGAKFCSGCGRQVAPAFSLPPAVEPAATPQRQGRLLWIISGVVIMALGGLAGGYYWGKSGDSRTTPPAVTAPAPAAPQTELPPRPGTQTGAVPSSRKASEGRETGFAALPPPQQMDRQNDFTPLPPPPPLDQKGQTSRPSFPRPDSSRDFSVGTGQGPRWLWTSQRAVAQDDVSRLSPGELMLMRNEIYARHGWVFDRTDLQNYFGQQTWYRPKGTSENREAANRLAEAELTPLERLNVKTILQYEKGEQGGGPRWSWTSQRVVTRSDLRQLSPWELVLMRNEIYARHGWVFDRADLQNYFGQQAWYRPKGTVENREAANRLAERELTALERRNIKAIIRYEKGGQEGQ